MKKKITVGFVVQEFTDDGKCTSSTFVASDQSDWVDDFGETIDPVANAYHPFDMVQPKEGV